MCIVPCGTPRRASNCAQAKLFSVTTELHAVAAARHGASPIYSGTVSAQGETHRFTGSRLLQNCRPACSRAATNAAKGRISAIAEKCTFLRENLRKPCAAFFRRAWLSGNPIRLDMPRRYFFSAAAPHSIEGPTGIFTSSSENSKRTASA